MSRRPATKPKHPPWPRRVWVLAWALVLLTTSVAGAAVVQKDLPQPADFRQCLQWALKHSPRLQKSALEIKVRKLSEWDAKWAFVPSVHMQSRYFFGRPEQSGRPYELKFTTGTYNPVGAYFSLQANRLVSRIAVVAHVGGIEAVLARLAKSFLKLHALQNRIQLAEDRIALARRVLAYTKSLRKSGSATGLQVEVAEQTLEVAQARAMSLAVARQAALNQVKVLMGMDPSLKLALDLPAGLQQVIGSFDPKKNGLDQARRHSLELKVQRLKEQLQAMNITLAYTKFLPTFHMTLENPDPLTAENENALYFSVGIELAIWEGFKQVRNVQRQRMILQQFKQERRQKELSVTALWQGARDRVSQTRAALKLASTRERLTGLREREALIAYQVQQTTFPAFAARRMSHLEARGTLTQSELAYHEALVDLRRLTGDLLRTHLTVGSKDFE